MGEPAAAYTRAQKGVAMLYGVACHGAFALGVAAMAAGLHSGMRIGRGSGTGAVAIALDSALVAQFGLLHSFLLSARGRPWLASLAPLGLGPVLSTTTFALLASLQLLLTFLAWTPLGPVAWEPHGALRAGFTTCYGAAWLLLMKTMADAGLATQTGWLGWSAVVRGQPPAHQGLPTRGTFRRVRQPIYVAFALTLWTGPVWTPDHLLVATGWTIYCLIGPLHKERRYRRRYGARFDRYRALVPYWVPRSRPADLSALEDPPPA